MLSTLVNIVFVVALATHHVAAQGPLSMITPALTQCQDAVISYSGGQGHYNIYVLPSGDPCADTLVAIPEQAGMSYKWTVNIPALSRVELMVEDATTSEAWSGVITVQNSSDASCVDPNATKALIAANSLPQSSSSASSISSSSALSLTPSTTVKLSPAYSLTGTSGAAQTVVPAGNPSLANAAGSSPTSLTSSAFPRAGLPACSLLGVATVLLTVIHLT